MALRSARYCSPRSTAPFPRSGSAHPGRARSTVSCCSRRSRWTGWSRYASPAHCGEGTCAVADRVRGLVRWDAVVALLLVLVLAYGFGGVDNFGSQINLSFLIGNVITIA